MIWYAVIDTNVIVSSLLTRNRDSATAMIMDAVADQKIIPLYNAAILEEYEEVLHRPRFPFHSQTIDGILRMIQSFGRQVDPHVLKENLPDPDDVVFYEVVMEKREDDAYLITGNTKHFPVRPFIVTPAQMVEIMRSAEASGNSKQEGN